MSTSRKARPQSGHARCECNTSRKRYPPTSTHPHHVRSCRSCLQNPNPKTRQSDPAPTSSPRLTMFHMPRPRPDPDAAESQCGGGGARHKQASHHRGARFTSVTPQRRPLH
eukprot:1127062-Pyramimonas_sp.AAC.1